MTWNGLNGIKVVHVLHAALRVGHLSLVPNFHAPNSSLEPMSGPRGAGAETVKVARASCARTGFVLCSRSSLLAFEGWRGDPFFQRDRVFSYVFSSGMSQPTFDCDSPIFYGRSTTNHAVRRQMGFSVWGNMFLSQLSYFMMWTLLLWKLCFQVWFLIFVNLC